MKIVVTGAKGRIGSYTADYARQQGHTVLGVDHIGLGNVTDYLSADLTDLGQVYDALYGADAVVNLAAFPTQRNVPSAKLFTTNTAITWNVFEAASKLGIKRVVFASTIQMTRSVTLRNDITYPYFPIDEAQPVDPQEDYSMSKRVGEVLGDMFSKHYGLTVVSLRFTAVAMPEAMATYPLPAAKPPHWAMYAYVDVRDAARCAYLAATAPLPDNSHTRAFVIAKDTLVNTPSKEIVAQYFPAAEIRGPFDGYASLISGETAKTVLGFEAQYSCRNDSWREGL